MKKSEVLQLKKFIEAGTVFCEGWTHFLSTLNFDMSTMDARAIRWMNEAPGLIERALKFPDSPC